MKQQSASRYSAASNALEHSLHRRFALLTFAVILLAGVSSPSVAYGRNTAEIAIGEATTGSLETTDGRIRT